MNIRNFLVTGPPRCGKSTVIERFAAMSNRPMTGFFTREIREQGRRTGFRIVTLDGAEGILAHEQTKSAVRVGKYRVNLEDLDRIAVPSMIPSSADQIVLIDEIGKMECYSAVFRETLINVLDAPQLVIGSIALKGGPFIESIKKRPDVAIIAVTQQNRDSLADHILSRMPEKTSAFPA